MENIQKIASSNQFVLATVTPLAFAIFYAIFGARRDKGRSEYWQNNKGLLKPSPQLASDKLREYTFFDNVEVQRGVAIIRFNCPGKVNTISPALQAEAEKLFKENIVCNEAIKAVVFISSKPECFVVGADIDALEQLKGKTDFEKICKNGIAFFDFLRSLKLPLIAAISGPALGGGLEWAMHCDYRIATNSPKTSLGLPEVKIGLLPGLGGTYLLPALIGLSNALDLILTGRSLKAAAAKKLGLLDLVVDVEDLETAAILQAEGIASGKVKLGKRSKRSWTQWLLEGNPLGRWLLFSLTKKEVDKNGKGFYPAPLEIFHLLKTNFGKSRAHSLTAEAQAFARLMSSPVTEALLGIFHSVTAAKKHDFGALSKEISSVGVIGAGVMGAGIAQVSAVNAGYKVYLADLDVAVAQKARKTMVDAFKKRLKQKRLSQADFDAAVNRVITKTSPSADADKQQRALEDVEIVFEAVSEDIGVKHQVLKDIEAATLPHCIFATNTSAIPISLIAQGAQRPDRVIGMHYSNPVVQSPFLEIISHQNTAPEVAVAAAVVGTKQGKTPIFVKDVPGFYLNRCLCAFLSEAACTVADGVSIEQVDKAMVKMGFSVGPFAMLDLIGLDIAINVLRTISSDPTCHSRYDGVDISVMETLASTNALGRKSGIGFYVYNKKGKKQYVNPAARKAVEAVRAAGVGGRSSSKVSTTVVEDIQNRLISRMVNEAVFSLQDGIIRSPGDGDIGLVFGAGFPPFLGGPFRLLDMQGPSKYLDILRHCVGLYGSRFEPAKMLKDVVESEGKFHSK